MTNKILLAALLAMYTLSSYAMRCGTSLVLEGDSKYSVQNKCGDPLAKDVYHDPVYIYNEFGYAVGMTTNNFEVWTYQESPNEFRYQLLFQDGELKSIRTNRSF
ncbi:DUF2845 domain-containing protein [Legionella dresdenensis]|uniref:DUF2845 domain-containing protein n=1 Tax=Legionella dresdenensis TaxID=450200 RepID=A0ABV8CE75_9GAMM